jgi:hypothetical protein
MIHPLSLKMQNVPFLNTTRKGCAHEYPCSSKVDSEQQPTKQFFAKTGNVLAALYFSPYPVLYFFIFQYVPMLGIQLAFKKYSIKGGIWGSPGLVSQISAGFWALINSCVY